MTGYVSAMRRTFDFSGRSTRSEFWLFTLVSGVLLGGGAQLLDNILGSYHRLFFLVFFVHLVPSLSVSARRLHDTNRAGGWYFLVFTVIGVIPLIVFYCQRGTAGRNRYGEPDSPATPAAAPLQPVSRSIEVTPVAVPYGTWPVPTSEKTIVPLATDAVAEIERLAALRSSGALTEAEFANMKARILSRPPGPRIPAAR